MAYAIGKKSKAISDRSGVAFPYTEMRKEWNGSLVHKSEYEEKHPQLEPSPPPYEPQALFNPRPDRVEPMTVPVGQNIFDASGSTQGIVQVGIVTVVIS
jgi:hypothetical protein|tara:strand:+ start:94 stop:390 length:297 start_codon:yes stop_codon:yes gene_type:complete